MTEFGAPSVRGKPVRTALPTGTVTFLVTDIEGSTGLVQTLGPDRYEVVLARHRTIIRSAIGTHAGREVATEGDSFLVVFRSPAEALAAAVDAQRALGTEGWPPDATIRVRMGIHTGTATLDRDGSYVGADIHRAARIGSAGHGGQIVLSAATRTLVGETALAGVRIRDLGEHRLKDLAPERLADVLIDGLAGEFPPLRAAGRTTSSLPAQLTSFVGRDREVAEIVDLLGTTRLLTITGPGGIGKTRLALAVAAAREPFLADGAAFVPLEPVTDPDLVEAAIGRALGVRETGGRTAGQLLREHLADHAPLIVLDTFEQVIGAASLIPDLLRAGPGASIVVTSRAALRVSGEQEYPLGGLGVPVDPARLSDLDRARLPADRRRLDRRLVETSPAVQLFVARAAAVRPGFAVTEANAATIARICARLDGLPLAIELAAARVRALSPDAILARLEDQLGVLGAGSRDVPARQRTLRGAIAWSHDLLDEASRHLLARLSVFAGAFDVAMAEAVAGPAEVIGTDVFDGVVALADQSLVRAVTVGDEVRHTLPESIRAFAAERLAARDETGGCRDRHARAFLDLAEAAEPFLQGDDQLLWLERLEMAHDDVRAALAWSVEAPLPDVALRLVAALWRFWQKRGYLVEARARVEAILAQPWADADPRLAARAYEAAGGITWWIGDPDATRRNYAASLARWRTVGDRSALANALYNSGLAASFGDRHSTASVPFLEEAEAIYRDLGDDHGLGNVLWGLAQARFAQLDWARGRIEVDGALDHFRRSGDPTMEAWSLHMSGLLAIREDNPKRAADEFRRAIRHFQSHGDVVGSTLMVVDLALAAGALGEADTSIVLRAAATELERVTGAEIMAVSARMFPEIWEMTLPSIDDRRRLDLEERGRALTVDDAIALALTVGGADVASDA